VPHLNLGQKNLCFFPVAREGTLGFHSTAPEDCRWYTPVVSLTGAGDVISFGFIGISEVARSLP
jgi:hypothetical protein